MIQFVPLQILKRTSTEKEEYLKSRCAKLEKALKAGAPDRDASQDERKKQEFLRHLLLLAEGESTKFSLTTLEDSTTLANARSFQEKVAAMFPLIDGESLIEEQTGRAGSQIYVKQVTNFATLCFTDGSLPGVREGAETAVSPASAAGPVSDNAKEEAEALQKKIKTVVDIGKGLGKAIPAPYGTVLSGIFEGLNTYLSMTTESESKKDTEKLINRISDLMGKITWKANVQQTVMEKTGLVYSVIDRMANLYGPLKKESKSDDTRKELVDTYLKPGMEKLSEAFFTLSEGDDIAVASLPEYCLAASAYISVLQELAVLDANHQDDPFQSVYCAEVRNKAAQFISYVNSTYDKIIQKAMESVSSTTEYKYDLRLYRIILACPSEARHEATYREVEGIGRFAETYDICGGWYYDNSTFGSHPDGFSFCPCHDKWAYETCGKARDKWISDKQNELVQQIDTEMGPLKKLANEDWAKLKTHPLYGSDRIS